MKDLADKIMMNEAFQAALQRYAHGNGSSAAIANAAVAALPPPGRGMVPMTSEQIDKILAETLDALARFYKMEHALHVRTDIAEHSKLRWAFAHAIEAAHGITAPGATALGDGEG